MNTQPKTSFTDTTSNALDAYLCCTGYPALGECDTEGYVAAHISLYEDGGQNTLFVNKEDLEEFFTLVEEGDLFRGCDPTPCEELVLERTKEVEAVEASGMRDRAISMTNALEIPALWARVEPHYSDEDDQESNWVKVASAEEAYGTYYLMVGTSMKDWTYAPAYMQVCRERRRNPLVSLGGVSHKLVENGAEPCSEREEYD